MKRKRHTPEEIIKKLREAATLLAKGDCWNGGGLFAQKKAFWLNDGKRAVWSDMWPKFRALCSMDGTIP